MPKQRVTAEAILSAALSLVRAQGYDAINARSIARALGCSVQPIYSSFGNMEGLMTALYNHAKAFYHAYIQARLSREGVFPSIGEAHICFAREEPALYRFLFLSPHMGAGGYEDVYRLHHLPEGEEDVTGRLALSLEDARRLYLHMMIYTSSIACSLATGAANPSHTEVCDMVNFAYAAFLDKLKGEKNHETDRS